MSSKKKKVYLLFLPLWMGVLCFFAYQIGYKKGLQQSETASMNSLSSAGELSVKNPKVERLTFFDTLRQPPQIPHEMIEPPQSTTKDSVYVPAKTSVENIVDQELKKQALPADTKNVQEPSIVVQAETKSYEDEKKQLKQYIKDVSREFTLGEIKQLPWAVQVGAFSDGVQAVLLQKELQKKGYPAFTAKASDALVKVYVGGATQNQSHLLKKDLENSGYLKSFVVKRAQ